MRFHTSNICWVLDKVRGKNQFTITFQGINVDQSELEKIIDVIVKKEGTILQTEYELNIADLLENG